MARGMFFFILMISCIFSFSQSNDQIRDVGIFNAVLVKGSADIVYIPSEKYTVVIRSQHSDDIITELKGNKLLIFFKKQKSLAWSEMNSVGKKYVVYVYAPFLEEIESMGSGNVVIDGILKSDSLAIKIAGSGNFSGQLNVESLTLKSMGSGNFRLRGNVMNANISSSGSGNLQGFDLLIDKCTLSKSGSGNTQLSVVNSLLGSISGSGNMTYKGNPPIVSYASSGSGKVKKV